MRANMNRARAFGRRVAEAQDEALRDQESLREARALWLAPARPPRTGRPGLEWRLWGGVATAVSLAAAATFLFFAGTPASRLAFQVGPSERALAGATAKPGVVGELVAAPDRERLPVRFSDGSVVRLEQGARARFVEVTDNGSRVLLESGVAHAKVVHRGETRWTVQAGEFEVRVTGTEFDVAWDPPRGLFSITLQEGRVLVSGCAMEQPRAVAAGETFRATCKDEERAKVPVATSTAIPVPIPSSTPISAPLAKSPSTPIPTPASQPTTWRELLALHRYAEAFDVADAVGLSSICASTDVATLMDLSDAARFAGHSDRAKLVLQEVRRRFAGDERASTAAFNLGRIAFDDESAYADAARWFGLYLTERPAGPLAREASGRRMEALEHGDHAAAKRAAERYLEDFPAGPHAEVARSIAAR